MAWIGAALVLAMAPPQAARAADRWTEAGSGAVAILPAPVETSGITGGSLYCAEQRWALRLRLAAGAVPAGWTGEVELSVGQALANASAGEAAGGLDVPLDPDFLAPLRAGNRLGLAAGDLLSATFPLRGSAATIDAIAPRCSPVDLSAYVRVELSPDDPGVARARNLLADEARLFRAATGRQPDYSAATLALAEGRSLLFAALCGSTAWYGPSGCTLVGHASDGPQGEWRVVYATEGLALHIDPLASSAGWPDLVTLSAAPGAQPERWTWDGTGYANAAALLAEAEPQDESQDDPQGSN